MFLKSTIAGLLLLSMAHAAPEKKSVVPETNLIAFEIPAINPDEYVEANKKWKKVERGTAGDFKSASKEFNETLMKPWLNAKTSEQLSALLNESHAKYDTYAPDVKYFLAQLHTMIPLKGIVWRLRPLFETGGRFSGTRMTHMSAIQMVRNTVTGLSAAFPTAQTDAMIGYFTKPGPEMTEESQFSSIAEFQNFLVKEFVKYQVEAALRIKLLEKDYADAPAWVWDNKMFYGTASFKSDFKQFVGHGSAERHIAMAVAWEAAHDAYVFSAYNQNDLLKVAAKLGRAYGLDLAKGDSWDEMGLTDKERIKVIKNFADNSGFLELRGRDGAKDTTVPKGLGAGYMKEAYTMKWWSVHEFSEAYAKIENKGADATMAINPILYQGNVQNRLNSGVKQMKNAMDGVTEFWDPVSSSSIKLNVPNYYKSPPESLVSLMANDWEPNKDLAPVKGRDGKALHYRNYFSGRSTGWDNKEWSKYVPSAKGKDPKYMLTAKRIMHYSVGATPVFGAVDLLVR